MDEIEFWVCVVNGQQLACTDLILVWANLIAYARLTPLHTVECQDHTVLAYVF
jgi:hypothetical protein